MPKVSVIIPTYNRAHYVTKTIETVLTQTYKDYEIVVMDDGSTDNTQEVLSPYKDKIRYFRQDNSGPPIARNNAIKQAKGEYLALLDDDDLWKPNKLEEQVKILDASPELAFVSSATEVVDENGKIFNVWKKGDKNFETFDSLLEDNFVFTLTVLMRKDCFFAVGGFDQNLQCCQDYDLWLRLSKRYKFKYIDKSLTVYREHRGGISKDKDLRCINRFIIFRKKEILGHLNFFEKQVRLSKEYYRMGLEYLSIGSYFKTGKMFFLALLHYPFIGKFYWPEETESFRFSWPYRVGKIYFLSVFYLIKGLTRR